ncbi:hypothetical protein EXIGLDRAFT_764206 [Exidia glandulosa HHB12029]|uniref:Uncharacterized protein n=1 Tax=Exidia glandulosa HHB12029 TaxID=1314781 RepID=A0A166B3Z6_EXIGL|nr:hypothetical protein EXIGLDRAFT_764206 [Exidia glandulosa HHB12029]
MGQPVWTTVEQRQFLEQHKTAWRTASQAGKKATKEFFEPLFKLWFERWPSSSAPYPNGPKGGRRNEVESRQQAIRTWYAKHGLLDENDDSKSAQTKSKKQLKAELHKKQALNATGATGDDTEILNSDVLDPLATPTVTFRPPKLLVSKKLSVPQTFSVCQERFGP